jgi:hypothetical protein
MCNKVFEALTISKSISFESPCIKERISRHSWQIRWLIFNRQTVHSTTDRPLNIFQFQKERYSRIQQTKLFLLRVLPGKFESLGCILTVRRWAFLRIEIGKSDGGLPDCRTVGNQTIGYVDSRTEDSIMGGQWD